MAVLENPTRSSDAQGYIANKVFWGCIFAMSVALLAQMASIGRESRLADSLGNVPIIEASKRPLFVDAESQNGDGSRLTVHHMLMNEWKSAARANIVLAEENPQLSDEDMPVADLKHRIEMERIGRFRAMVDASIFPTLPYSILSGGIEPASTEALTDAESQAEEKVASRKPGSSPPLGPPPEFFEKFNSESAWPEGMLVPEKSVPAGTYVAQLGSFSADGIASSAMQDMQINYSELIGGRKWIIQEIRRDTYSTYRLRLTGFSSHDEAEKFCNSLRARGRECVPANLN